MFYLVFSAIIVLDFSGGFMGSKIRICEKTIYILSSGIVLIMGVQHIRANEVKKLSQKLSDLKFEYDGSENTVLNDVYFEFISQIEDVPNIHKKYIEDKYNYKVHNYIPTISDDFVSYTFYDDYIKIDLLNNNQVYSSCYYNNDGSYYIVCNCENDLDDRLYTFTYSFSPDGVLTDSVIYDGFFEKDYKHNDDIGNYMFVKAK